MEEIKIGEYCRNNRGYIFKVIKIMGNENENQVGIFYEEGRYNDLKLFPIVKHSLNIIDLIKVGDYVNGFRVSIIRIGKIIETGEEIKELWCNMSMPNGNVTILKSQDIKSIVTKEQFNQVKYEV